ncbi:LacI family DNA-binding transcriptional regulator [Enterococcus plantarum]|uniref:LacI family DNA-binding transcriptional regulator n=1 Tax=Enterococcus plantarum TaxID=1077675 RepID=UPI003BF4BA6B
MANIRDIAKLSGYSVTTVSHVLTNHPYVSEEKRAKITQIMHELDYIPNAKAWDGMIITRLGQKRLFAFRAHIKMMFTFVPHP